MNATVPARLRIVAQNSHADFVDVYGFAMFCEFEFYAGEKAILWPTDNAHPGSPPNVQLLSCAVGGINIYDMLTPEQIERIEDKLIEQMDGE